MLFHAYFDNLLPDSAAIREQIKDRLGADSAKPFDLLASVGKDCVGALTFTDEPATGDMPSLSLTPLSEKEVAQMIRDTRLEKNSGYALRFRLQNFSCWCSGKKQHSRSGMGSGVDHTARRQRHIYSSHPFFITKA